MVKTMATTVSVPIQTRCWVNPGRSRNFGPPRASMIQNTEANATMTPTLKTN